MDFNDSESEAKFRAEVREWLAENAPKFTAEAFRAREGGDTLDPIKLAKAWQGCKADAGYACLLWPKEYGGRGATPMETVIYGQEEAKYPLPGGVFGIGIGMAGPVMMKYATDEQKLRYLPKLLRGEEIWSQLFSEPCAGSDVAGLRTRAIKDGDDWIINGQKVWTSGAHYSDYGIIVTRHDPSLPKHMGLTYFFLDMKSPGIEINRIKQISGESNFCEVFFSDVRIPDSQRLGEVGDGWSVALTTLMNERLAVGGASPPDFDEVFDSVCATELESGPAIEDMSVREKLADWYVQSRGIQLTTFRTMTALSRGQTPGPEASIGKLVTAKKRQEIASFTMDLQEMGGVLMENGGAEGSVYQEAYLSSPGGRIAGGTDEILMNIIAERVLGLPPDIRVDKKLPFSQLPTGDA
ncbi:MAG: acyl-CoA dehydrogenase family protein [Candidatus Hydrogenedentes bacterium]|nr:acyl-CoA dehydrogenase family protein [Candidatus Hydrogenedentota bacterium]